MARVHTVKAARVEQVNIVPEGIVITFKDRKSAFIESQFLYDYQDVNGNYPLDEDECVD